MAGSIRAGGLASGLDTDSIIESLVTLQGASVTKIESKITTTKVKISSLGEIASKLKALQSAAGELAKSGVRALAISSKNDSFSASVQGAATAGRFDVEITGLATAAKARSAAFSSETAQVKGGQLHFDVDGSAYDIAVDDGASLKDVAAAINDSDAPVNAAVLFDGEKAYLSVTRNSTGFAVGQPPSSALQLSMTTTGSTGEELSLAVTQTATNTVALVDGLRFERRGTSVAGAIPGVTLEATKIGAKETVVVNDDTAGTHKKVQGLVDAYNAVAGILQGELNLDADTDRGKTLAGDSTLRFLQQQLAATLVKENATGGVRSLADLGLETGRDGKLALNTSKLDAAIARGGDDVDRVFSGAFKTAIDKVAKSFADDGGIIDARTDGLAAEKKRLEADVVSQQARIDKMKDRLIAQFSAMESIISKLNKTGDFLTSLSQSKDNDS